MELTEEEKLISRSKNDSEAFGELYDNYHSQIYGYILKRTGNIAIAEDITSDTFFKALDNLSKFRWQGYSFSSWLYRIANNCIIDHYRKASKEDKVTQSEVLNLNSSSDNSASTELIAMQDEFEKNQQYVQIHKAIMELPINYQEVISLRYFENKKVNEIASIVDKPEGTVKSLISRGMDMLSEKLN